MEAWRTAYDGLQAAFAATAETRADTIRSDAEERAEEERRTSRTGWAACLLSALLGWAAATAANVFRRSG